MFGATDSALGQKEGSPARSVCKQSKKLRIGTACALSEKGVCGLRDQTQKKGPPCSAHPLLGLMLWCNMSKVGTPMRFAPGREQVQGASLPRAYNDTHSTCRIWPGRGDSGGETFNHALHQDNIAVVSCTMTI